MLASLLSELLKSSELLLLLMVAESGLVLETVVENFVYFVIRSLLLRAEYGL